MERLYKEYSDQVEFLIVYIREAHPEMLKEGNELGIVGRPKTIDERVILATECATKYELSLPMVIDYIAGDVAATYEAKTIRTTITDRDGNVAYYAKRGPWGFKISEIERALKKLVANDGYMPPPPEPIWGEIADGLVCGITVEPQWLTLGEEVVIELEIKNVMDVPVALVLDTRRAVQAFVFENDLGQRLVLEPAGSTTPRRRVRPQTVEPGESYETTFEGKLVAASENEAATPGAFGALFDFEFDEEVLAAASSYEEEEPLWMGRLSSGRFPLDLALKREVGCISCHGGTDFHHQEAAPACNVCHTGQEGSADFGLVESACVRCHRRGELRGRRQILGEAGEFSLPSAHCSGEVDDQRCLACHDWDRHGDGEVRLVDPRSDGARPWRGTPTEFCLTCHGGHPPDFVSFPVPTGSGHDKSTFPQSEAARGGATCSDCHTSHGSMHRPLLRHEALVSPHR